MTRGAWGWSAGLPASARDRPRALPRVGTEGPVLALPRRNEDEYDSSPGAGGRGGGAGGGPPLRLHPQDRRGAPGRVLQVSAPCGQRSFPSRDRVRGAPWGLASCSLRGGRRALPPLGSAFLPAVGSNLWPGTFQEAARLVPSSFWAEVGTPEEGRE